jgi:hypothetical protein
MQFGTVRITFESFQARLLRDVRQRIQNGDFTERGLARIVGISQPHLHNVLKGVRALGPELGDLLLAGLDLSLLDLLSSEELGEALQDRQAKDHPWRHVPILEGRIGPEDPFPNWRAVAGWVKSASRNLSDVQRPAFVRFGRDSALSSDWQNATFGLLDFHESARTNPREPVWYVLRWNGAGLIRQVRMEGSSLIVLGQRTIDHRTEPEALSCLEHSLLQVVRARVVWVGPDPDAAGQFSQRGFWLPRAARE